MIVSANQPYFAPYPGFFYKARLSDVFVILDEVQFPRKTTWVTRNRFKENQRTLYTERIFGVHFPLRVEPYVFTMAERLSKAYRGGYWHFYTLKQRRLLHGTGLRHCLSCHL